MDAAPDPHLLAEIQAILEPVKDVEWPSGLSEDDQIPGAVA
jgi:hypothetical protein